MDELQKIKKMNGVSLTTYWQAGVKYLGSTNADECIPFIEYMKANKEQVILRSQTRISPYRVICTKEFTSLRTKYGVLYIDQSYLTATEKIVIRHGYEQIIERGHDAEYPENNVFQTKRIVVKFHNMNCFTLDTSEDRNYKCNFVNYSKANKVVKTDE